MLTAKEQEELHANIQVFLSEKRFEGCAGLEMTDEIRVTIAAQACMLLLNRPHDYYPGLQSILVYPAAYVAPDRTVDAGGIVIEGEETRFGEAWLRGAVILSWENVQDERPEDGSNLVLHEFAHQLDQQDGSFDGAPVLEKRSHYASWARILTQEFEALRSATEHGETTLLDQYGATNPAEFFAVITEAFFENPRELMRKHPELYQELKRFFRQDTLARLEAWERKSSS